MSQPEVVPAARTIDDLGVVVHPADEESVTRGATLAAAHSISCRDAVFVDPAVARGCRC